MTTLTVSKFNNKLTKTLENPKYNSRNLVNYGRTNDCNTPFRNPYNHWRKTSTCGNCDTNEKILVDNVALSFGKKACYSPYIKNILNKNGIRDTKFLYSTLALNHKRGITFEQNNVSNVYDTRDLSNNNTYKISPEEFSDLSSNYFRNNCC